MVKLTTMMTLVMILMMVSSNQMVSMEKGTINYFVIVLQFFAYLEENKTYLDIQKLVRRK